MSKQDALRIVRLICKAYQQGDSDETLAWRLMEELKELEKK